MRDDTCGSLRPRSLLRQVNTAAQTPGLSDAQEVALRELRALLCWALLQLGIVSKAQVGGHGTHQGAALAGAPERGSRMFAFRSSGVTCFLIHSTPVRGIPHPNHPRIPGGGAAGVHTGGDPRDGHPPQRAAGAPRRHRRAAQTPQGARCDPPHAVGTLFSRLASAWGDTSFHASGCCRRHVQRLSIPRMERCRRCSRHGTCPRYALSALAIATAQLVYRATHSAACFKGTHDASHQDSTSPVASDSDST